MFCNGSFNFPNPRSLAIVHLDTMLGPVRIWKLESRLAYASFGIKESDVDKDSRMQCRLALRANVSVNSGRTNNESFSLLLPVVLEVRERGERARIVLKKGIHLSQWLWRNEPRTEANPALPRIPRFDIKRKRSVGFFRWGLELFCYHSNKYNFLDLDPERGKPVERRKSRGKEPYLSDMR